jgi:hypothetical protein
MQQQKYRSVHRHNGRLDHRGEIPMDELDALEMLGVSYALHTLTNWTVAAHADSRGFTAVKGDVRRSERIEQVTP